MGSISTTIKEDRVKVLESKSFFGPTRIGSVAGAGTFATNICSQYASLSVEMGASRYMSYALAYDNNLDNIRRAALTVERLRPPLRRRVIHPLRRNRFKAIFYHLPSSSSIGFDRDIERSADSIKLYHQCIKDGVKTAAHHELSCGSAPIQIRPCSLAGGHVVPQWLLNYELMMRNNNPFRIGLASIPHEHTGLALFKQIFPVMLASKRYGFQTWLVWDSNLSNIYRPVRKQDELILKGIIGTFTAYLWESSQPGPGDIWNSLKRESNGFVGAAAVEEDLVIRRRLSTFWKKTSDKDVAVAVTRNLLHKVIDDQKNKLIAADFGSKTPQIVVITGNIRYDDYLRALDQTYLPRNVSTILAPSKSRTAAAIRLVPLSGRIQSLEHLWKLKMKGQAQSYTLPNDITEKAIESIWDVAEKVAEFAGVTPEELLECE